MSELVGRLQSHMGKADMAEVLRDCRLAAHGIPLYIKNLTC